MMQGNSSRSLQTLGVQGLGFRVRAQGSGLGAWGLGLGAWGLGMSRV